MKRFDRRHPTEPPPNTFHERLQRGSTPTAPIPATPTTGVNPHHTHCQTARNAASPQISHSINPRSAPRPPTRPMPDIKQRGPTPDAREVGPRDGQALNRRRGPARSRRRRGLVTTSEGRGASTDGPS